MLIDVCIYIICDYMEKLFMDSATAVEYGLPAQESEQAS